MPWANPRDFGHLADFTLGAGRATLAWGLHRGAGNPGHSGRFVVGSPEPRVIRPVGTRNHSGIKKVKKGVENRLQGGNISIAPSHARGGGGAAPRVP